MDLSQYLGVVEIQTSQFLHAIHRTSINSLSDYRIITENYTIEDFHLCPNRVSIGSLGKITLVIFTYLILSYSGSLYLKVVQQ